MPKIALINMLNHKHSPTKSMADERLMELNIENEALHEFMKDTGFTVYSDPKFLYLIGKICARSKCFLELAV
jgi:hypothetical protein